MAIDDNTSYELTGYQVKDIAQKIRAKADSSSLASVATSGLYSDLTGAPTIPTVYNGTLTIQQNGTTKGTFTANQSSASTVNIETIYADDYISTSPIPTTVTTAMIENDAVTTAKIDDGAVTAAKTAFGGNYSTSEVDTGFTWIDGKPIYKKTINTGVLPQNGAIASVDISSLSVDIVVDYRGIAWASASKNFRVLPFVGESMNNMLRVDIQGGTTLRILSTTSSDWGNYDNSYITLWYTKTTD